MSDLKPGTVPPWVIRYAYNGEEWLALSQRGMNRHHCGYIAPARTFRVAFTRRFERCGILCSSITAYATGPVRDFDTLAEAQTAFDRMEREWLGVPE